MNGRPCYRRNLTPPRRNAGTARSRARWIALPAVLCALSVLFLAGCSKSANQYIKRGNELFKAGRYADATINYRNAIQKRPDSGEAYYRLGLALMKQSQVVDAYQAFNHAVTLAPKNMPAKVQFGNLSLAIYTRDPKRPAALYNQAKTMADQLLGPGGDRVEGLRLKGALALIDNQPAKALDLFGEAAKIAPDNPEIAGGLAEALVADKQPEEAVKVATQNLQRHPKYNQAYEVLYAIYGSEQDWAKAEGVLKQWIANNPRESGPVLRLAAFYYARKQADDAEKTLDSLLEARDRFPQADLLVGDFHAMTRDNEKALADYQRGESRDSSRELVYQQRVASVLVGMGKREEALKAADAILKKDPKNQFARALKVEVLDQIGGADNQKTAAALAKDLAKETPANANLQLMAGQAAMIAGNLDDAATFLQHAAQASPRSLAPQLALARLEVARKNYAAVLEHANAALAIVPNDKRARLFRVIGLTGTRSYASAKSEAEQLAHDTKDAPQVEMQLAVIALGQGRYADAEDLFRKLYKEGSPDLEPLAGLVDTFEAEHMPDKALALMRQETQRSPDSKGKQALLAATAEAAGKNDLALSELQKMAAENPSSSAIQLRLGAVEQKNGNAQAALAAFERARQLDPGRKGIDALVANLEEQSGHTNQAITSYRKALKESPEDPVVLNNLAFLLAESGGDTKEALQMIGEAIRKGPNLPQLRDTLAWIEIKRHNVADALPILESLINKYPNDNTYRYHYAVALMEKGDRSGAREQVETALSQKPSGELAGELRNLLAQVK
jgi:tetratricopeptide (TPR) repeat protein